MARRELRSLRGHSGFVNLIVETERLIIDRGKAKSGQTQEEDQGDESIGQVSHYEEMRPER